MHTFWPCLQCISYSIHLCVLNGNTRLFISAIITKLSEKEVREEEVEIDVTSVTQHDDFPRQRILRSDTSI